MEVLKSGVAGLASLLLISGCDEVKTYQYVMGSFRDYYVEIANNVNGEDFKIKLLGKNSSPFGSMHEITAEGSVRNEEFSKIKVNGEPGYAFPYADPDSLRLAYRSVMAKKKLY